MANFTSTFDMNQTNSYGSIQTEEVVNRFQQRQWIVAQVIDILSVLLVTWVIMCMFFYGAKTGKWRRANRCDSNKINAGPVYTFAMIAMVASYTVLLPSQAVFNLGYKDISNRPCETALEIYVAGYALSMVTIYTFLWFRHRSVYQHPSMSALAEKAWLRKLSWGSIFAISSGLVFAGLAYIIPENYKRSQRGCIARPKSEFTTWPIYAGNAAVIIGQALMLFMFLYPLRSQAYSNRTEKRIRRILKRSAAFAIVCVASDLFAMATLVFIVPESSTRHVTITVYNVSMMTNLASILMSFESWKSIVFGRRCRSIKVKHRNASFSEASLATGTYS